MVIMDNNFSNDFVYKLLARIDELTAVIEEQNQLIIALRQEIADLKERLNKNSKNSSKPPSSDGFNKPKPQSLRKPSGKKQGAQEGHEGKGFSIPRDPDEIIRHIPLKCIGCSQYGQCVSCGVADTRYEVDIQINTKVTAHQSVSFACPNEGGKILTGEFPQNITGTIQYGVNLEALAITLNTAGMVGIKRTHDILSAVFGVPISTGTIHNMVKSCAEKLADTVEQIRVAVINSPIVNFDETGMRVDKKILWVHNASTAKFTHLTVEEKRGKEGMDSSGVLPYFRGIPVHDCWKAYWLYEAILFHALCCAHLLRELIGVLENKPNQLWSDMMIKLLLRMKQSRDRAVASGKERLSNFCLYIFSTEYDRIIAQAREQNPIKEKQSGKPGFAPKGKVRCLVERLAQHKAAVCLFTKNFNVPFDNNQAERDVRMVKVKTKVSGCFRTKEGAQSFAVIMSFVGTANKHGVNSFVAIKNAVLGQPHLVFE